MPIALHHESDQTYRLDITGQLRKADWSECETALANEIQRVGSVKLLCVLQRFEGWEPNEDWNNLSFYVKHGDAIDRIAIVGQERWRDLALMFAAVDLRKGPVEFFPETSLAQARAWLSA
ncbi:MAG TPA: STAS/SEC14 domain-containing protein [Hyphomonadaceae bacterium]|nr:STAS/SEC14 domain-containing protein [Hyphomonadaceae bacterium]